MQPGSGTFRHDGGEEPTNSDLRALLEHHASTINAKLDRVTKFIDGDSEPERGAKIRLDRLEQDSERRKVWTVAAGTAAIGALATTIWSILTKQN